MHDQCEMTRHCGTEPPSLQTELQSCWRCAWGLHTSAMEESSMNNRKMQQWIHPSLLQWPTSIYSSLKTLHCPRETPTLKEKNQWHLLHCEEGHYRGALRPTQQHVAFHQVHHGRWEGQNAPVPGHRMMAACNSRSTESPPTQTSTWTSSPTIPDIKKHLVRWQKGYPVAFILSSSQAPCQCVDDPEGALL